MSQAKFLVKAIITQNDGVCELQLFSAEFTPLDDTQLTVEEWAQHFLESVSEEWWRTKAKIPEGCFEIVANGVITGTGITDLTDDYNEEIVLTDIKTSSVPQEWINERYFWTPRVKQAKLVAEK